MNVKSVTEVDDAVVARVSDVLEFAFPGQKFNVLKVCDSGVYNMINVSWLDGPTEAEVRFITRAFEGKNGLRFVHDPANSVMNLCRSALTGFVKSTGRATFRQM